MATGINSMFYICLIYNTLQPPVHFYAPWKHQETYGFLELSVAVEEEH